MGVSTRRSTVAGGGAAVAGMKWAKMYCESVSGAWERKRGQLLRVFESNSKWREETRAAVEREAEERAAVKEAEAKARAEEKRKRAEERQRAKDGQKEERRKAEEEKKQREIEAKRIEECRREEAERSQKPREAPEGRPKDTANGTLTKERPGKPPRSKRTAVAMAEAEKKTAEPAADAVPVSKKKAGRRQRGKGKALKSPGVSTPAKKPRPSDAFSVKPSLETGARVPRTPMISTSINELESGKIANGRTRRSIISVVIPSSATVLSRHAEEEERQIDCAAELLDAVDDALGNVQETAEEKTDGPIDWVTVSQTLAASQSYFASPSTDRQDRAATEAIPKIESWTSQFLKPNPIDILKTPARKPAAAVAPSTAKRRRGALQLVDAPLPVVAKPAVPTFAHSVAPASEQPVEPAAFVNPTAPVESPLTKAKRLDTEFAQREQKLKAFLTSGSDDIKKKLGGLRGNAAVAPEPQILKPEAEPAQQPQPLPLPPPPHNPLRPAVEKPSEILKEYRLAEKVRVGDEPPAQEAIRAIDDEAPPETIAMALPEPSDGDDRARHNSFDSATTAISTTTSTADHFDLVPTAGHAAGDKGSASRAAFEEQKKRLQERQTKAIERKRFLQEKAQMARAPKPPLPVGTSIPPAKASLVSAAPVVSKPLSKFPTASAIASIKASTAGPMTPEGQKSYKMPLPKTMSPLVVSGTAGNGPGKPLDLAVKTVAATPESLPEIRSEEDRSALRKAANFPEWTKTPHLVSQLATQGHSLRPEDIFGEVQPIKLEEFFKDKKFGRSSTSGFTHHHK